MDFPKEPPNHVLSLTASEFEEAIAVWFNRHMPDGTPKPLEESFFDKVRELLEQSGKSQWSKRPRIYTVLRHINRLDAMSSFVTEGCMDLHFPFNETSIPDTPGLNTSIFRYPFIEAQRMVFTEAAYLEIEDGQHGVFDDADVHFYETKRPLGQGAFGKVDAVRSKLSLTVYARKRIQRKKTFLGDKKALRVFENEIRNLRRLRHIHLIQLIGTYTDRRYVGLILTPVADCDLKAYLGGAYQPNHTSSERLGHLRHFFGCLASAVTYLHSQKCRHKDIKPSNILVKDNRVLLTDFGTARDWSDLSHGTTRGPVTEYTKEYAAPEVVDQAPRGEAADMWSLGCVYFDMITVLKGQNLTERDVFFYTKGSGLPYPRTNLEATILYLDDLRRRSKIDNQPLTWIEQMLKEMPRERISASALYSRILDYGGERHMYYGECCSDYADEEESFDEDERIDEVDSEVDDEPAIPKHLLAVHIGSAMPSPIKATNSNEDLETEQGRLSYHIRRRLPSIRPDIPSPARPIAKEHNMHFLSLREIGIDATRLVATKVYDGAIFRLGEGIDLLSSYFQDRNLIRTRCLVLRSLAHIGAHSYRQAEHDAWEAVSLDPTCSLAWEAIGDARVALRNYVGGIVAYERASELDYSNAELDCPNSELIRKLGDARAKVPKVVRKHLRDEHCHRSSPDGDPGTDTRAVPRAARKKPVPTCATKKPLSADPSAPRANLSAYVEDCSDDSGLQYGS